MSEAPSTPSVPAATTPTSPTPTPSDPIARSPTGEILEPSQIQPTPAEKAAAARTEAPAPTSTKPEDKPTEPKPDAKAPETYAAFKAPEGYTLDAKALEGFTPIAKELGLTQDQAQRLVDFHSNAMINAAKAPESAYSEMRQSWQAKVTADPELAKAVNGDKTGLDAVKLDIARALNTLEPALATEFKEAMNLTGVGDHPAFVKAFWKLSQFVTEGRAVTPRGPSPHGQAAPGRSAIPSAAEALYPHLPV